ncbi:lipid A export permease/ATP-binding protein MsbA [Litorilituus sediminis]|uniref:Lipid A export permease/ATP-binding protein MsbA n=1 Tax=Litorilituus sediminis TaxID=718192 RepID=A0A4P6P5W7_9GAMM|nr:lipid A export permease/ATP-binding protein MsbA [Litorilituus sediminis]QBG36398.1 lipid A export permease/ATP-binding protein MsbA [Litorilituus sediminis]
MNTHQINNRQLLARLFTYYQNHKKLILIAFIALCLFSLIDAGMIYFVKPLIDEGLAKANSHTLQLGAALVIAIFLLRGLASFAANYTIGYMSSRITYTIRQQAFEKLLCLPMQFFDRYNRGQLIAKLIYDTEQISQAISKAVVVIIRESVIIIVLLAMMLYNSWQLTAIFLLVGPIIAVIISRVAKRFKKISANLQTRMGEVTKTSEQAILNQQDILLLNTAAQVSQQFSQTNHHSRQQAMKLIATAAQSNPIIQLIASLAIAAVLLLASFEQVLTELTPGTFTLVLISMGSLLKPLKQLSNVNQHLQKGLAAANSLFNLLDEQEEIDQGSKELTGQHFSISFRSLSFSYPKETKQAITKLSAKLSAGTTTAIVGESGSGKTTLSHLLLRLYQAPKQSIFINNIAIEEFSLSSLRAQVAFVSQNIVLIDDSIANNIRFGCHRNISNDELIQAAKAANVLEFSDNLPLGLDSQVGENGRLLSGGQKQRIAIARAFLRDANIIILDEATSALDNKSEQVVQQAFKRLAKNKTMLIIAHRLSTIADADNILVLKKGRLIEQGNHQELVKQQGNYWQLFSREQNTNTK